MSQESVSSLSQNTSVPLLPGWVSITEAASILEFTRQYCYRLAQNGYFDTLHRVGVSTTFVISTKELEEKKLLRKKLVEGVADSNSFM